MTPDFIGLGVARAATTWIHKCLEEHPQICLPKSKSLNILLWRRDLFNYQFFFSHCQEHQRKGHIETSLFSSRKAPGSIRNRFPKAKLIVCLRNPIERLYSHYLLKKSRGEPCGWEKLKEMGLYSESLKRYLDIFPKEQILVLIYEDIQKNPLKFIQSIYRFLGVNSEFVPQYLNQKINPTSKSRQRIPLMNRCNVIKTSHFLKQSDLGKKILATSRSIKFPRLINFIIQKNVQGDLALEVKPVAQKPATLPETRACLQEFYKEDIAKLEKFIKRDLNFWR